MKKLIGLMAVGILLMAAPVGWTADAVATHITEAGNKFCPVSGDKIDGKHFVNYKGKQYGLCCPMCAKKLRKSPEKYFKKMSQ